jgi:hypothetical protein
MNKFNRHIFFSGEWRVDSGECRKRIFCVLVKEGGRSVLEGGRSARWAVAPVEFSLIPTGNASSLCVVSIENRIGRQSDWNQLILNRRNRPAGGLPILYYLSQ